jgi:hypothetical protein
MLHRTALALLVVIVVSSVETTSACARGGGGGGYPAFGDYPAFGYPYAFSFNSERNCHSATSADTPWMASLPSSDLRLGA